MKEFFGVNRGVTRSRPLKSHDDAGSRRCWPAAISDRRTRVQGADISLKRRNFNYATARGTYSVLFRLPRVDRGRNDTASGRTRLVYALERNYTSLSVAAIALPYFPPRRTHRDRDYYEQCLIIDEMKGGGHGGPIGGAFRAKIFNEAVYWRFRSARCSKMHLSGCIGGVSPPPCRDLYLRI